MAARIRITVDDDEVRRALDGLSVSAEDLRPALETIGARLEASTKLRFRGRRAPDGVPWKPSRRALAQDGQTLVDSGRLRDSIGYEVGPDHVTVGTNVRYAATHQFGARKGSFGTAVRHDRRRARGNERGGLLEALNLEAAGYASGVLPLPWGDIPARPFLGLDKRDRDVILSIIRAHLAPD